MRPAVEFNARFTLGTLVLAELRRALPGVREQVQLAPGVLRGFRFVLEPGGAASGDPLEIVLGPAGTPASPRLCFSRGADPPPGTG